MFVSGFVAIIMKQKSGAWKIRIKKRHILASFCAISMVIYLCAFTVFENETNMEPPPPLEKWISDFLQMGQDVQSRQIRNGTTKVPLGYTKWTNSLNVKMGNQHRRHSALLFHPVKKQSRLKVTASKSRKVTLPIKKLSEKIQNGSFRHYFVNNSYYQEEKLPTPTFNYTIYPTDICKPRTMNDPETFLLTLIFSDPADEAYRLSLRRSWLAHNYVKGYRSVSLFLLGRQKEEGGALQQNLLKESRDYDDIIQGDFVDSFRNQSYKLLMGLRWASSYCPYAKFIMKLDNQTLPVFSNIIPLLETIPDGGACLGYIFNDTKVIRDRKSVWYTKKADFAESTYPSHPSKSGYIFSASLVNYLISISHHIKFLTWENIFVSMLLNTVGVGLDHNPLFGLPINETIPDPCVIEEALTLKLGANFTSENIMDIWGARAMYSANKCAKPTSKWGTNLEKAAYREHDMFNG